MITFQVSTKDEVSGKSLHGLGGLWKNKTLTTEELARWMYLRKSAIAPVVLKETEYLQHVPPEQRARISNRRNVYARGSSMIVVDLDFERGDEEAVAVMKSILDNPFIKRYAFIALPSSSYNPETRPNYHFVFKINATILDTRYYRELVLIFNEMFENATGMKTDHQLAKMVQVTYGTVWKDPQMIALGYSLERDVYINPDAEVVDVENLMEVWQSTTVERQKVQMDRFNSSAGASAQTEKHLSQSMSDRERVVLEALEYALKDWGLQDYGLWTRMWMAANHGAPTENVCEYIVNHPDIQWSGDDPDRDRDKFRRDWDTHEPDGVTVATLFWMAKRSGWLSESPYEVKDHWAETIDTVRVSDWQESLEELPDVVMLQSQTGTGKTFNIISLYKRLKGPKTVIFSPTTKLATELTATLVHNGLPAVLYTDAEGRRRAADEMHDAPVLVTTLQSFSSQVYGSNGSMANYDLVVFEESDQLISQFARASVAGYSTHVREYEAKAGFRIFEDAINNSGNVWFVDATMTEVTLRLVRSLKDADRTMKFYRNKHVKSKAPVTFVPEKEMVLTEAYEVLMAGGRVAIATDTAVNATEVYDALVSALDYTEEDAVLLIRDTSHTTHTKTFMQDVNLAAPGYKLVVYNSSMGSGVSITSMQPDLVVLMAEYLTPRVHLQMLNRYRLQRRVVTFYRKSDRLYARSYQEVLEQAQERIKAEAELLLVELPKRTRLTAVRDTIAAISIADEEAQGRSPRTMFENLLKRDGRLVFSEDDMAVSALVEKRLEEARELLRSRREEVARQWRDYPLVDYDHPPSADATAFEVACGIRHGEIIAVLGQDPEGVPAEDVDKIVRKFHTRGYLLYSVLFPQETAVRSLSNLIDPEKAMLSMSGVISALEVISTVSNIFHSLGDTVEEDTFNERAYLFIKELGFRRELYDNFVPNRDSWENLFDADNTPEMAYKMARALLRGIGLKMKKTRITRDGERVRAYKVDNISDAVMFLSWKYRKEPDLEVLEKARNKITSSEFFQIFSKFTEHQQVEALVLAEAMRDPETSRYDAFQKAVKVISNRA
jgi:hypothetical protein